jgi:S-adenosylmethionine:tRNA ribosyltransferase-isomerase
MIAAALPIQRPPDAKLLVIDARGRLVHAQRSEFLDFLRSGDLVIANDAATLPASLRGLHLPTGRPIEVRLAGRDSLAPEDINHFSVVIFGAGDYHIRTEDRPAPPPLAPGDILILGPLHATVEQLLGHPRLALIRFDVDSDAFWAAISRHGHPIQYAHLGLPLALWDTWTPIAGPPVAFEPPSAGFVLDWKSISAMRAHGINFATITHAAGISSTGDAELDRRLPFDEPYRIPSATAEAIAHTHVNGGRFIAIGTTVVRALEHAAGLDGVVRSGEGLATQRIDATTHLRVVNAILSGTHESDTSHYQLLRAFANDETLLRADQELETHQYRTHEFGDSVFIEESHIGGRNLQIKAPAFKSLGLGDLL